MISLRSMRHAKKVAEHFGLGPPEKLPGFIEALHSKKKYILVLGKWVPFRRKKQTEETKKKISQSMKGKKNRKKKS
jgi:hypothetical protein